MKITNNQYKSLQLLEIHNPLSSLVLSLYGGQVLSWIPASDKRERLFLSDKAVLDASKSIRGGIPVCWPWFGAHPDKVNYPAHGYVRNRLWNPESQRQDNDCTTLVLVPESTEGPGFAGQASLHLEIIAGTELCLNLVTSNEGKAAFPLSCALHTYFSVSDINNTALEGLHGVYSDKTRNWQHFPTPSHYNFHEETDRIHLVAAAETSIVEPRGKTHIVSCGHDSIVVWNPWADCARNFADMSADGFRHMLCVETALTQGRMLEPGETHTLTQRIS